MQTLELLLVLFYLKKMFFVFLGLHPWHMDARGQIGAVASSLCHRHSNIRSKMCLQPIPQRQILNPLNKARGEPASSWILVGFITA